MENKTNIEIPLQGAVSTAMLAQDLVGVFVC
jgi:hypothetical protein